MNDNKVVLPREVAEAIEELRSKGMSNYIILDKAQGALYTEPDLAIKRWAFEKDGGGTGDLLMTALVNGYTVEQTPEELAQAKVRKLYEEERRNFRLSPLMDECGKYYNGKLSGIIETLNLLGIKTEGVNA